MQFGKIKQYQVIEIDAAKVKVITKYHLVGQVFSNKRLYFRIVTATDFNEPELLHSTHKKVMPTIHLQENLKRYCKPNTNVG